MNKHTIPAENAAAVAGNAAAVAANAAVDYEKIAMPFLDGFYDTDPIYMIMEQCIAVIREDERVKVNTEAYRINHRTSRDMTQAGTTRSKAKQLATKAKNALPVVIPPVYCKGGKSLDSVVHLVPIMAIDQDHITPEQLAHALTKLRESPYVWMCEPSPSDEGVRSFFKIKDITLLQQLWDEAKPSARLGIFRHAWQQLADYVAELTGIPVDEGCAKPTQPYTLAHCDAPYYNPDAEPFEIDMTTYVKPRAGRPKEPSATNPQKASVAALSDVVDVIAQRLENDGRSPENGRNVYLHHFASHCNHYGVAQDEVLAWALAEMEEPDFEAAEIRATVESAYKRTEEHGTKRVKREEKARYCSGEELQGYITSYGAFRFNEVTLTYEVKTPDDVEWRRLRDEDENEIYRRILMERKVATIQQIHNIIRSGLTLHYNPFLDYLTSLPACTLNEDGACLLEGRSEPHDYIAEFAQRVEVKGSQEEFLHYFRIWYVAMVKSWAEDDFVNQYALGLFGKQGIYKTTFFQLLLPHQLRKDYLYLKTNSARFDKDDKIKMAMTGLICLEEMDTMTAAEMNHVKALFTMNSINERPAYGRNVIHMLRRSSFAMTGNETKFLTDTTGSRRFFPFEVVSIEDPRTFTDY